MQPGYSDGGVSELRTAMQVWTSYTSAAINYSYVGSRSGSMGGTDTPNGVNEVLFNDPLNEISGTWNRNTGGVVGLGGFNGVSSKQTWTSTFAADPTHPLGTFSSWNITEGNLTIQDGVSSTQGISSKTLAEIVAHEFGHTLGFGHSAATNALMYESVTGLGPSLRTDDQTAARWLYPNGTGTAPLPGPTPQVPAAPGDLRAIVSGGNIDLSWVDRASNETGHAVYLAAGNGAFSKVATVGANTDSTRLSGYSTGTYRIYVVAFNGTGDSAHSNTATATVAAAPTASFSMTPQSGTAGLTSFTFYDESTGGVLSRLWDFGDGATSNALVATHVYATAGFYTVTLTVYGAGTSSTTSKTINVIGTIPPFRTVVSVATYGGGIGGTAWRTELSLFNAGSQGASVQLTFLPSAGGSVRSRSFSSRRGQLGRRMRTRCVDLSTSLPARAPWPSTATSAGSSADLRVTSRTFTTGQIGTYGQSVPDVQPEDLDRTLYITGIAANASFRTNIGLVNRGPTADRCRDADAVLAHAARRSARRPSRLPANSFQQSRWRRSSRRCTARRTDVLTMRISAPTRVTPSARTPRWSTTARRIRSTSRPGPRRRRLRSRFRSSDAPPARTARSGAAT